MSGQEFGRPQFCCTSPGKLRDKLPYQLGGIKQFRSYRHDDRPFWSSVVRFSRAENRQGCAIRHHPNRRLITIVKEFVKDVALARNETQFADAPFDRF